VGLASASAVASESVRPSQYLSKETRIMNGTSLQAFHSFDGTGSDRIVRFPRWRRALALSSLLLLGAITPGCDDEDPVVQPADPEPSPVELAPYDARGPYAVGFRELEAPATEGEPAIKVKVWYPAAGDGAGAPPALDYDIDLKPADWQAFEPSIVRGHAVRDAPFDADGGARPLVVFSHGYSVNPEWYAELVEHYASKGFVVLAPEHAEADWMLAAEASFARPRDVSRTLDLAEAQAAPGGTLEGLIDVGSVGVVGHSYGGYTALAIAGARFDLAPFEERCAALAPEDPKTFFCAPFLGNAEEMASLAGLRDVPSGLWPAQGDPRVDAIIPIAGDAYLFNAAGLASVTMPMMAIGGTMDTGTPWEWGAQLSYDHVSSADRSLIAFEGADHMIPMEPCENMPFVSQFPELYQQAICQDPAWDKAEARRWIRHYSTAFLLDVLAADADAHAALLPDSAPVAGIVYTTTLR
jgi:predicted dienelactone hydrolase